MIPVTAMERTIRKTVTFARPFRLDGTDEVFPQGDYDVETDEALIEGLSFVAYHRVGTFLHLHSSGGLSRTMTIDPAVLEAALTRDLSAAGTEGEVL